MPDRAAIEQQIRALLTVDADAVTVSNRLFQQGSGLFPQLGRTLPDRGAVVGTELWALARRRLRDLEARDLARFREVVRKVEESRGPGTYVLRLETAGATG